MNVKVDLVGIWIQALEQTLEMLLNDLTENNKVSVCLSLYNPFSRRHKPSNFAGGEGGYLITLTPPVTPNTILTPTKFELKTERRMKGY